VGERLIQLREKRKSDFALIPLDCYVGTNIMMMLTRNSALCKKYKRNVVLQKKFTNTYLDHKFV